MAALPESIRDARLAKGWTQEDLAERVRVTRLTVSHWECGRRIPRPRHLKRAARALDMVMVWTGNGFVLEQAA